jgi:hypothetical protein
MIVRMVYSHPVRDASLGSKIGRNNELLHPVRDASLGRKERLSTSRMPLGMRPGRINSDCIPAACNLFAKDDFLPKDNP